MTIPDSEEQKDTMSEGYFAHNGSDLFYTVQGPDSGIPILLLHGWTCDLNDWVFQIPLLLSLLLHTSQRFRVIAPDLRGHGRSAVQANITYFDPITLVGDAAALSQHLNISIDNPAIVVGHSLGGVLAQEFAVEHPELVRGLVLIDPSYFFGPADFGNLTEQLQHIPDNAPQLATAWLDNTGVYPPGTPEWLPMWHKLRAWGVEPRVVGETFVQMVEYVGASGSAYLGKLKAKLKAVPRLVVAANPSSLGVEKEAGLNGTYDRVEVLQVGHWLHKADPNGFNALLESWLRQWGYLSTGTA